MNNKSIQSRIKIIISLCITIVLFGTINIISHNIEERKIKDIYMLEKTEKKITNLTITENESPNNKIKYNKAIDTINNIKGECLLCHNHDRLTILETRKQLLTKLFSLAFDTNHINSELRKDLHSLTKSIKYIHEYHIAYIKNIISTETKAHKLNLKSNTETSEAETSNEVEIINAAISVQGNLYDILDIFLDLSTTSDITPFTDRFDDALNSFYASINSFEDHSLDAQDGLLVEELLLSGKTFEQRFKKLLSLKLQQKNNLAKINANRNSLNEHLTKAKNQIAASSTALTRISSFTQLVTVSIALIILTAILIYSAETIKEIKNIEVAAQKIQADHSHQISPDVTKFKEFQTVYSTLNTMAAQINKNITQLQEAHDTLELRIKERTKDLQSTYQQLAHAGRLTALGEMATGIAHEINQPLTIIDLACQYLSRQKILHSDHNFLNSLTNIRSQITRATNIITNMRSFARADTASFEPINLKKPTERALSFFHEQFRLHQIKFDISLADKLPYVKINPQQFEQIVVNLVSNARYAVESKTAHLANDYHKEIKVLLYPHPTPEKGVIFEISDNGVGMHPKTREHCLEPFYTTKGVGEGTGLGLSIVYNIIHGFKGDIEIDSTKGEGTTFRVFIPAPTD